MRRGAGHAACLVVAAVASVTATAACGSAEDNSSSGVAANHEEFRGWFGGYLDVTLLQAHHLNDAAPTGTTTTVLSFISADPVRPCEPSWGGSISLEQAKDKLDLDAQLETYRKSGNRVAVSFGGQKGTELAVACTGTEALAAAYAQVIDRYGIDTVDLDIEGRGAADHPAAVRRAGAMARLQAGRPRDRPLHIWLTLPVSRSGLSQAAVDSVETMLSAGVEIAGVNIMTMNFGPLPAERSMLKASMEAAQATHQTLTRLYEDAGLALPPHAVWKKIGLTPMIGVNDVEDNVFTIEDAKGLNAFAREQGVGRMSMWSLNRDLACEADHAGPSHSCSGVTQEPGMFAELLGAAFE